MNKLILQIEDEEHDILFLKLALEAVGAKSPLCTVKDGDEAIAYLQGTGKYGDRLQYPLPGLILLDLRLPHTPGLDVLRWVRQQPAYARLPVLVLSSSAQDKDVRAAYELGANGYIVKPPLPSMLSDIVGVIKKYWLDQDAPPRDSLEWRNTIVTSPLQAGKP